MVNRAVALMGQKGEGIVPSIRDMTSTHHNTDAFETRRVRSPLSMGGYTACLFVVSV